MNKKYLWIIFLLCSISSFAQRNKADKLYNQLEYNAAIPFYNKAATKTADMDLLLRLADCYYKVNDMVMAEYWYRNALKMGPFKAPSDYLQYGKTLKSNERYDEAKEVFKTYIDLRPDDKVGKMLFYSCEIVKNWPKDSLGYQIGKVSSINTEASDFCPVFYKDGIVYTSSRRTNYLEQSVSGWTGKSYQDLFYAEISRENIRFYESKPFSEMINSPAHDGPACFSDNSRTIYFTRVSEEFEKDAKAEKQMISRLKIYSSDYDNGKWSKPVPFPYNSDNYSVGHPGISKDGKRFFFASDMPGGRGGTDIYFCDLQDGTWAKPQNAGAGVNTAGNEKFPYVHSDETLYFSSDGRTGYGGLDIFSSEEKNGGYAQASNLKYPVNSSMDDFGIILNDNSTIGYISSNRKGGVGEDDIYFIWKKEEEDTTLINKFLQVMNDSSEEDNIGDEGMEPVAVNTMDSSLTTQIQPRDSAVNFSFKSTTYVPDEKKERDEEPVNSQSAISETLKPEPTIVIEAPPVKPEIPVEIPSAPLKQQAADPDKFYTVQIGRYNASRPQDSFPDINGVEMTQEAEYYIYHVGKYSTYQEAKSLSLQLKDHLIPGAFVTAYINGKKVALSMMREKNMEISAGEKPASTEKIEEKPAEKPVEKIAVKPIIEKPVEKVPEKNPENGSLPECYLTVQLGKFSKEKDQSLFKNIPGLIMVNMNKFYVYSIGKFKDYAEAAKAAEKVKEEGFPDAFISARLDGQSVKIEDFISTITSGKCVCNTKP